MGAQIGLFLGNPLTWILTILIVVHLKKRWDYKHETYYLITHVPYGKMRRDTGKYGEYLIYKRLKDFEKQGWKFLFNTYVPKADGQTSEIDVLLISPVGVFVFESKNYSGWIFGGEKQKNWYQTLPRGRGRSQKESFYNPILQNQSHIKHLKLLLGDKIPAYSLVVFSDRCTFKDVRFEGKTAHVIHRNEVYRVVSAMQEQAADSIFDATEIDRIYKELYPYTQMDAKVKEQHIQNIHTTISRQTEQGQVAPVKDIEKGEKVSKERKEQAEPPQCPVCRGKLVVRTARRGNNAGKQFLGCSNYLNCRYIKNI